MNKWSQIGDIFEQTQVATAAEAKPFIAQAQKNKLHDLWHLVLFKQGEKKKIT